MRTIHYHYKVVVSPDKEQSFLNALAGLVISCYKDYEEIIYENGFEEKE